uniref:Uncharacterized protein n=1 Tax=viral metagenome TaxID=1070528 RepID=A0A6M3KEL2_9ZZZZ
MVMAKNKKGKCFIDKKSCNEQCVLYRRGLRYFDDKRPPEPFEECAINIIADSVENIISRTVGLQAEQNKVANNIADVAAIMKTALQIKVTEDKRGRIE